MRDLWQQDEQRKPTPRGPLHRRPFHIRCHVCSLMLSHNGALLLADLFIARTAANM
jgi:hypothetical protein